MNDRDIGIGTHWKHYKGGVYEIIAVALDESTKDKLVVYRRVRNAAELPWVRPMDNFLEMISSKEETAFYRFDKLN